MAETWGKTKIIHCSYVRTYKTLLNIISGKRSYGGSRCIWYLGMVRVQFPAPCWFGAGCFICWSFLFVCLFFPRVTNTMWNDFNSNEGKQGTPSSWISYLFSFQLPLFNFPLEMHFLITLWCPQQHQEASARFADRNTHFLMLIWSPRSSPRQPQLLTCSQSLAGDLSWNSFPPHPMDGNRGRCG